MSFRAVLWALDQDLPPITKLVLVALASFADKDDSSCFPKVKTIGQKASVKSRTVHRKLRILERGHVRIEKKYRGKGRRPNTYWLNLPTIRTRRACDTRDSRPCDTRVTDKKNHYRNHNNRARQEAENTLTKLLGSDGWEILIAFPEMVPLLVGKLQRGTLKKVDLLDLRARFTLQAGNQ